MTLVYILTAYLLFALLDGAGYKISETYITLLGQWGLIVMTAYFGGRTVEKVMEMRKGGKE
jgi:Na+-driven multidrug efflux pump